MRMQHRRALVAHAGRIGMFRLMVADGEQSGAAIRGMVELDGTYKRAEWRLEFVADAC